MTLALDGVTYRHAGALRPALRDVSLAVADGEVLGVVGANEAGKSTLCLVLAGLAPRVVGGTLAGRLLVDGEDVAGRPIHELAGRVGIVFDDPGTQHSGVARTVYEEIAFGPSNLAVPRAELIDRTEAAIELLGLGHLAARDPARLSGGQQQLVAIASMLAMRPRHLVLDEPTAQLDPAGTALVGAALDRLAATGVSIVLVEHKTDLVAAVASRVVALDAGRVVLDGPVSDVLADPRLPDLGVAPPARIRLRARLSAAGLLTPDVDRAIEAAAAATSTSASAPSSPEGSAP